MSKSKWSADFRAKVAQEYLDGKASFYYLADKYHIGRATIQKWVAAYKVHGIDAFICGPGNASYTSEFKTMCVEKVISGYGSSVDIGAKYKLHPSVLESWIRLYNANRKLKDYDPKREVYMAEARRKTTIEERKKIVTYCIEHNCDYKGTAALYDVSYSQVYSWVQNMILRERQVLQTGVDGTEQMMRLMSWKGCEERIFGSNVSLKKKIW